MIIMDQQLRQKLEAAARDAAQRSYSPYSHFPVGAAILTADGQIFTGANIENASFGLTNCAERTAIFKAVSEGAGEITHVVVYTPTPHPTMPCGACRQVIREFGRQASCVSICDSEQRLETTLEELLPHSFGPEQL